MLDQGARNVGMADLDTLAAMLLDERPLNLEEPGWIYELKYDGYWLLAEFGQGSCRLRTGKGADASKWFPEVCQSLAPVRGGLYITDGEVCVLDEYGRSDVDACRTERVGGAGMTVHGRWHTWSQARRSRVHGATPRSMPRALIVAYGRRDQPACRDHRVLRALALVVGLAMQLLRQVWQAWRAELWHMTGTPARIWAMQCLSTGPKPLRTGARPTNRGRAAA